VTSRVVAVVPARNAAGTVGPVVDALVPGVDEVIVVDDASGDGTAATALAHGATVLSLPDHTGKGGAVAAGVDAVPDADVYLLVDADTGASASGALALLAPVLDGAADLAIGVLPPGATGGLGVIRRLAAAGIERACGIRPRAPLSGQRAVRAGLLRRLALAPGFGLETAMTIDARRAGARIVELDVAMTHRATGRSAAGFAHRAAQGVDVMWVLWHRVPRAGQRLAAVVLVSAVVAVAALWTGTRAEPTGQPARRGASKVVIFGIPYLSWSYVGTGTMPSLDGLIARGATAALNVRTVSDHPSSAEGWASLGAGIRTRARAADAVAIPRGDGLVVPGAEGLVASNRRARRPSLPGSMGQALESAGRSVAVLGHAGTGEDVPGRPADFEPAVLAAMDRAGRLSGDVGQDLVMPDARMAFGRRVNAPALLAALDGAVTQHDVVVVDSGDLERAAAFALVATPQAGADARALAVASTDALLAQVVERLPRSALLLAVPVVPPASTWHTEPVVAAGAGVVPGGLFSPATGRAHLVTLDDVAPTVLAALGVPRPAGMTGQALRYQPGAPPFAAARNLDRQAVWRERIYFRTAVGYIVLQCLVYLVATLAHRRGVGGPGLGGALRWAALAVAAWPLATYSLRALPGAVALGLVAIPVLAGLTAVLAVVASRLGRAGPGPLVWLMAATIVVIGVDLATGARLQTASLLGYSLHTASRYRGIGNTAFAALAAATVILGAIHVERSGGDVERSGGDVERSGGDGGRSGGDGGRSGGDGGRSGGDGGRSGGDGGRSGRSALAGVACLFAVVVVLVGAPPLGAKIGGTVALAAVLPVTWLSLAGRRIKWWGWTTAIVFPLVVAVGAALIDLARPPGSRTHLGRFASDLLAGRTTVRATVARRLATDLHYFKTGWNVAIVVLAALLLVGLGYGRRWTGLLPTGSAARTGAVAALAVGLLGSVLEDSGSIVVAMVFVFLGPWLVLRALEHERPPPALIRPAATAAATSLGARP
jgi:glycosyl transferase family 2